MTHLPRRDHACRSAPYVNIGAVAGETQLIVGAIMRSEVRRHQRLATVVALQPHYVDLELVEANECHEFGPRGSTRSESMLGGHYSTTFSQTFREMGQPLQRCKVSFLGMGQSVA